MHRRELFFQELARGVIAAGGALEHQWEKALKQAYEVWTELQQLGTDTYPCMVEMGEIRYIYQWDENPPVIAVMLWDDQMWRDMAYVQVPADML